MIDKAKYYNLISKTYYKKMGRVSKVIGLTVESIGPDAKLNDVCKILLRDKPGQHINAEVVGFKDNRIVLMPFENVDGIGPGCIVENTNEALNVNVGEGLLGKTVDGLGVPTDGSELQSFERYPVEQTAPDPMDRVIINEILPLGVKAVDGLLTIGKGQRIGIFAGSGVGKSTLLGMFARNTKADINVIALIGERGREVREFIERDLGEEGMKRSVVVVATSDKPALIRNKAAKTATAIAEYFRDMGYKVAIMADSTSRWAEALREMSGRLEEMPGEEGYPAYLSSRLAEFYERAGIVETLGSDADAKTSTQIGRRTGAVTAIGAVSPPGGDISEPVSQATLRIVKVYWGLSSKLAYSRHFPAIDWLQSYSLYRNRLETWFDEHVSEGWNGMVDRTMSILQQESELDEIVRLVGIDALSFRDRLTLEAARSIREDYLHQNAFHEVDTYTSLKKQYMLLNLILSYYDKGNEALDAEIPFSKLVSLPVREQIGRFKYVQESEADSRYDAIVKEMDAQIRSLNGGEQEYA